MKRVFQIAYNEGLLVTRAEMLKKCGYDVVSVLGNDAAKRILDTGQHYNLFIVGRDAPHEEREEMFQWLRAKFPTSKILALTSEYENKLTGADYCVPVSAPEQWLTTVSSATS